MGKKDYQKEHTDTLLDEYVIARMRSHGNNFEVLIKPEAVEKFRVKKDVDILDNMPADKVFSDSSKGEEPAREDIEEVFGTTNVEDIATIILQKGDVQITTEQRRKRQENKRKDIIDRIVRNSVNPQTGTPHPPNRIENAMKEASIHIDPFKPVGMQIDDVVDAIKALIPLSFKKLLVEIRVGGGLYGKIYGDLKEMGTITREDWLNDGTWKGVVKITAGAKDELFEKINNKTKGKAELELLEE